MEIAEPALIAAAMILSHRYISDRPLLDKTIELMDDELASEVIGQSEAVVSVSDAIRRSQAGLSDANKPNRSFLFLGPTGVGKTELIKTLTGFLFDDRDAMIRIDMLVFVEKYFLA